MSKIMVVDDEEEIIQVFTMVLEEEGYQTVGVTSGEECLNRLKRENPDLILLDIMMPKMDGVEVLKKVRKIAPNIDCIMVTAHASVDSAITAMHYGASGYILKPLGKKELIIAVKKALRERELEFRLRESEEKFRAISTSALDAIVMIENHGMIAYWNPAAEKMFGYSEKEILGRDMHKILAPPKYYENFLKGFKKFKKTGKGKIVGRILELEALRKDGEQFPVEIAVSGMEIKDQWWAIAIIRDITERRKAEEEVKRQLMKFNLEDGKLYLVEEPMPTTSIEAFKDLLKAGYHSLVISRTPEEEFRKTFKEGFDFIWIAEKGKGASLPPKLGEIEGVLENLPRRSAILFDRLDYLVFKNGFKETLTFVQRLREIAYLADHVVILSIDPSTLSKQELRLLEKEAMELELRYMMRLPEDLLEVLRFAYSQNKIGAKPNYTNICRELGISKPTVSKRIRHLISAGYLIVYVKGRTKVVELTERGRRLFSE